MERDVGADWITAIEVMKDLKFFCSPLESQCLTRAMHHLVLDSEQLPSGRKLVAVVMPGQTFVSRIQPFPRSIFPAFLTPFVCSYIFWKALSGHYSVVVMRQFK